MEANLVPLRPESTLQTETFTQTIDHLRLDDGVAAIKWRLAIFISPMAAAALAPLKLLTQFGNLERLTDRHTVKTTRGFYSDYTG